MPAPPPSPGLCATCEHARRVVSAKGSTFWRCAHPRLPKYPPLPVRACVGYAFAESPLKRST